MQKNEDNRMGWVDVITREKEKHIIKGKVLNMIWTEWEDDWMRHITKGRRIL